LLALNESQAALVPLAVALRSEPVDPQPYLDYGKALLAVGSQPGEAVRVLQRAQEINAAQANAGIENNEGSGNQSFSVISPEVIAGRTRPLSKAFTHLMPPADPENVRIETLAYLAEALADGQLQAALQAYYRALISHLYRMLPEEIAFRSGWGESPCNSASQKSRLLHFRSLRKPGKAIHSFGVCWPRAYAAIHLPEEAIQSADSHRACPRQRRDSGLVC
jgi:hypothetical protein